MSSIKKYFYIISSIPSASLRNTILSDVTPHSLVDNWQIANDLEAKLFKDHDETKETVKYFDNEE